MDSDRRTVDEIQRAIERERAELGKTLNSLHDTLSYENISASIGERVRDMGSDLCDDLARKIIDRGREKPAAAGLILAGLAWMALGAPNHSASLPRAAAPQTPAHAQNPAALPAEPRPAPRFESTRTVGDPRIARLAQDAKSLRDRVTEGTETLSEEARARVVQARQAAADAAEAAVDAMRAGARKTRDVVQGNPVAMGGIALAIGATVGGVMLLRMQNDAAHEARNDLFRQADRVFKDELERSASRGAAGGKA